MPHSLKTNPFAVFLKLPLLLRLFHLSPLQQTVPKLFSLASIYLLTPHQLGVLLAGETEILRLLLDGLVVDGVLPLGTDILGLLGLQGLVIVEARFLFDLGEYLWELQELKAVLVGVLDRLVFELAWAGVDPDCTTFHNVGGLVA